MHSIDQGVGDTYLIAGELECARKYDGGAEFRTGLFGVINLSAPYLTGWHDLQIRNVGKLRQLSRERSEEHTSELQSHSDLVCRLLLEKKNEASAAFRPRRGLAAVPGLIT